MSTMECPASFFPLLFARRIGHNPHVPCRFAALGFCDTVCYPSLHVKKMQGVQDIWEARASRTLRVTFELQGDILLLRNVGSHDAALKGP